MSLTLLLLICGGIVLLAITVGRALDGWLWRKNLVAFRLTLPADLTLDDAARWLNLLAAYIQAPRWSLLPAPPLALEVVGTHSGIEHVLLLPARAREAVLATLRAGLPGARLTEYPNYLDVRPHCQVAAELTMTSVRRPLAVERGDSASAALLAALQPLHGAETIIAQFILTGAGIPKPIPPAASGRQRQRILSDADLLDSEEARAARAKQSDPLLAVSARLGVAASSTAQARRLFGRTYGSLRTLNAEGVRVLRRWYLPSPVVRDRLSGLVPPVTRWPLLLSSREAAGLFGLVPAVALPGLRLGAARQLPPAQAMSKGVLLGHSNYPGSAQGLRLAVSDRLQHVHVIGPTGVGKSTLLANMALQDMAAGLSVVVIDPKSDLCADLLDRAPEDRLADIMVLDPSATDQPIGFNILQAGSSEQQRELVVDHVIHIYHELYRDFWGPRTEDILRAALLTLINTRAPDGSAYTLIEIPELLTNAGFRRVVIGQPTVPPGLKSFWTWYQGLKVMERQKVIGPILNKLRAATLRSPIRLMLGQSVGLDIGRALNRGGILLAPLGKGMVGQETAGLLGTLLLADLWQALLARGPVPVAQRRPVMIYIDEMQDVVRLPIDLADMLAQARSMGGALHLAHQHFGQITDKQMKAALLGTVRSTIAFQLGHEDAATLAKSFGPQLTVDDLRGLEAYEIAARLSLGGRTATPVTGTTAPLPPSLRDGQLLARASRERHGRPRAEVEAALAARIAVPVSSAGRRRPAGPATLVDPPSSPTIGRQRREDTSGGAS
jgi:Type IV secretion-system coupling protein DNA-binding domain/Type IV secretory system Conjugative DNA transfer